MACERMNETVVEMMNETLNEMACETVNETVMPDDAATWHATDALMVPAGHAAKFLNIDDARQLINAAMFANWRKWSFTVCMTVRWDRQTVPFDPSPRAWLAHQGRLFERMSRWLERNDIPVSYVWAREVSATRIPHTHVFMRLPHKRWGDFRAFMVETGKFRDAPIPFSPIELKGGEYGTRSPSMKAGKLKYLLKGMDLGETFRDPMTGQTVNVMDYLRVDNRGEERRPLAGKRVGASRGIDRQARLEAGWRELTSLKDLYLPLNA